MNFELYYLCFLPVESLIPKPGFLFQVPRGDCQVSEHEHHPTDYRHRETTQRQHGESLRFIICSTSIILTAADL